MFVTFYGATREVTGSMHLITQGADRILLDCGMFQGRRKESEYKNKQFPIDAGIVTNLILSHAHIDHSGRIPVLTKNGYSGRIICTRATADAATYLLLDSAHIQESDAQYLNYKTVRNMMMRTSVKDKDNQVPASVQKEIRSLLKEDHSRLKREKILELAAEYQLATVEPLYSIEDANQALSQFDGCPYETAIEIGQQMTCKLYDAGHILGSAMSIITSRNNGRQLTIGFTGDIGRFDRPIINNPTLEFAEEDRELDLLIMESTYGDRDHGPADDLKERLKEVLVKTIDRGGNVLIPSFAFGRTQEIVYILHELYNEGLVPKIPVYVDSPLATNMTQVFGEHPEVYDNEAHVDFLQKGQNPFSFRQIRYTQSVEESMALMREKKSHIVIASSGMCEAGRILHHLRNRVHNPDNTILIVGYMAQHTLGRRILEQGREYEKRGRQGDPPLIKIMNKMYPLKAQTVKLNGFSAHADKFELLRFLKESNLKVKRIAVVHGEEDQSLAFAKRLGEEGYDAFVPRTGETVAI